MQNTDYLSLGFVSNDHLAVLPFIPMDTKVKMLSHKILGGGPAGNAAAGAATLGVKTAFVGTVGDDADGRMILEEFTREGVDTSFVTIRKGATSAIAYLWIDEKTGARSCAWGREGLDELTAEEVTGNPALVEAIRSAKILHLDGHNAAGAIAAAKIAKEAGVTIMYDAGTHRDGRDELLGLADLIICSEEFILKLVGERAFHGNAPTGDCAFHGNAPTGDCAFHGNAPTGDCAFHGNAPTGERAFHGNAPTGDCAFHGNAPTGERASGRISVKCASGCSSVNCTEDAVRAVFAKYHPKVCGATMGARGSMCFDGANFVTCPAFPVEKVVDTTGCGDLFHVGFAVKWLETHDLMECQRFGAAVSALKCRGLSGRPPSAPTRAEVEKFLDCAFHGNAPTGDCAFHGNAPTGERAFHGNAPTGDCAFHGNAATGDCAFHGNAPTGDCAFHGNAPTGAGAVRGCSSANCTSKEST